MFLTFFLLYSLLSATWTSTDPVYSLKETAYNFVHVLLFVEIIVFSKTARNPLTAIFLGFLVAFAISAVIAIWEFTTDQHLYTSKMKKVGS